MSDRLIFVSSEVVLRDSCLCKDVPVILHTKNVTTPPPPRPSIILKENKATQTKEIYIHPHTHTHTHVCVYIYIYGCDVFSELHHVLYTMDI
jgi:hypothetical protein